MATVYALGLLVGTGLVPEWGRWYVITPAHRLQTEAFLRGKMALSHDPRTAVHDYCWSEGGVHQVWGLGIPLWQAPFTALAKLCGQPAFPERLALGLFMALVGWAVLRTFLGPAPTAPTGADSREVGKPLTTALGTVALLLLFPPFVNLLRSRMEVYEDVMAYVYGYGVGLLIALVALMRRPSFGRWAWLGALAGFGALIRPTLLFFGVAALIVGGITIWRAAPASDRHRLSKLGDCRWWLGPGFFLLGGLLLYGTNWQGFGSGLEFGHQLNLQDLFGSMYATRFDHPFQHEPWFSAGKELFSALFLSWGCFNDYRWYQPHIIPWQSPTVRWREFYLPAFDLSFLALVLLGWATGWVCWHRCRTAPAGPTTHHYETEKEIAGIAAWSLLASVPLAVFYLRTPALASRYMLDFAPAFAGAAVAAWNWAMSRSCRHQGKIGLLFALVIWIGVEIARASYSHAYAQANSKTWGEVIATTGSKRGTINLSAVSYHSGEDLEKITGLHYNGMGWSVYDGEVRPTLILFLRDPEDLELDVERTGGGRGEAEPKDIRAKIGREFLRRESVQATAGGWRLHFQGPQQARYQQGIQVAFVAFGPPEGLADTHTGWRLQAVRWQGTNSASSGRNPVAPPPSESGGKH